MIDLVTDHEREQVRVLLEADDLDRDALVLAWLERAERIQRETRAAIKARPFGSLIVWLLDREMSISRRWWAMRDRIGARRYSARH